jgi:hypothetical protein
MNANASGAPRDVSPSGSPITTRFGPGHAGLAVLTSHWQFSFHAPMPQSPSSKRKCWGLNLAVRDRGISGASRLSHSVLMRSFIGLLLLGAFVELCAAELSAPPATLTVPPGFEGPVRQEREGAILVAYVKPRADGRANTLLQVNVAEMGAKLVEVNPAGRGEAADRYLLQFLGGIEKRRTEFRKIGPVRVVLGGLPAARVQWTGNANAMQMVGAMYCVVVGTKVVVFHTQDLGNEPTQAMGQAMKAIEAARLKHGN